MNPEHTTRLRLRRRTIQMAAAFVAVPTALLTREAAAQSLPQMTEGPFYPFLLPPDSDFDLTRVHGVTTPSKGEPLDWRGMLADDKGKPLVGARIEIWQCNALGTYHHPFDRGTRDAGFQGLGSLITSPGGRFAFRTIKPVPYPGRTPHIHIKIKSQQTGELTSQLFVAGDPGNERDSLWRTLSRTQREAVSMLLRREGNGWTTEHNLIVSAV
jgi:protocatechuate 3,4-dioxygenase, beta subunit